MAAAGRLAPIEAAAAAVVAWRASVVRTWAMVRWTVMVRPRTVVGVLMWVRVFGVVHSRDMASPPWPTAEHEWRGAHVATASAAAVSSARRRVLAFEGVEEAASTGPWAALRLSSSALGLIPGGVGVEGCWVDLWRVFGGWLVVPGLLAGA